MPNLMKCHYEVLESARDADADVLKKQYRKMALKVVASNFMKLGFLTDSIAMILVSS